MKALYRFLFPLQPGGTGVSLLLLAVRIVFGLLLLSHGVEKWTDFSALSTGFPAPFGMDTTHALWLILFIEIACSLGFIFGALYRIVLIPMILAMATAVFVVHGADAFRAKELALVYLVVFIVMYIAGPGKYSIDRYLAVRVS